MDIIKFDNLVQLKFWQATKANWNRLSVDSQKKWLDKAIDLTLIAWDSATAGTDLDAPDNYADFAFQVKQPDGSKQTVHSVKMYYGRLDKKCKNTWDNVVVAQILNNLCDEYRIRDAL